MRGIVIDLNDEHLHPLAEMQDFLNEPWHVVRAARGWRANGAESEVLSQSLIFRAKLNSWLLLTQ